ncbi:hypothetical protein MTO96_037340 [Rhipicephalus appendiculatus]
MNGSNADNEDLLQILHKRRTIYLTPTKLRGVFVLRFAICSRLTENEDVHYAWHEICAALETLREQRGGMLKHEDAVFSTPQGYVKRMPLQGEANQNRGGNRACANRLLEKYNQIKEWLFRN